jgi:hypothetical protein
MPPKNPSETTPLAYMVKKPDELSGLCPVIRDKFDVDLFVCCEVAANGAPPEVVPLVDGTKYAALTTAAREAEAVLRAVEVDDAAGLTMTRTGKAEKKSRYAERVAAWERRRAKVLAKLSAALTPAEETRDATER